MPNPATTRVQRLRKTKAQAGGAGTGGERSAIPGCLGQRAGSARSCRLRSQSSFAPFDRLRQRFRPASSGLALPTKSHEATPLGDR